MLRPTGLQNARYLHCLFVKPHRTGCIGKAFYRLLGSVMLIESIRCRERAKKRGNIWHIASKQHYFTWKLLHTILPCRQCVDDVAESQECDDHYKASHCVVKYADELTEWIKQFEGTCFKSWKPRGIGDDNSDLFNQSGNIMAKYDNKKTKYLLTASLYLSNYCCNASVPSNVFFICNFQFSKY